MENSNKRQRIRTMIKAAVLVLVTALIFSLATYTLFITSNVREALDQNSSAKLASLQMQLEIFNESLVVYDQLLHRRDSLDIAWQKETNDGVKVNLEAKMTALDNKLNTLGDANVIAELSLPLTSILSQTTRNRSLLWKTRERLESTELLLKACQTEPQPSGGAVKLPSQFQIDLWENSRYQGRKITLSFSSELSSTILCPSLKDGCGPNQESELNDKISSYKVFRLR